MLANQSVTCIRPCSSRGANTPGCGTTISDNFGSVHIWAFWTIWMSQIFWTIFVEFEVFIGCRTTIMGQFDVVDILDNLDVADIVDKFFIVFN